MRGGFRREREVQNQAGLESLQIPRILCVLHLGGKFWFLIKSLRLRVCGEIITQPTIIECRCRSTVALMLQLAIGFRI